MDTTPKAKLPPLKLGKRRAEQKAESKSRSKRRFMRYDNGDLITVDIDFKASSRDGDEHEIASFAFEYDLLASRLSNPGTSYELKCCRPVVFEFFLELISKFSPAEMWEVDIWELVSEWAEDDKFCSSDMVTEGVVNDTIAALAELWMIGHYLTDGTFCNQIMHVLLKNEPAIQDMSYLLADVVNNQLDPECALTQWVVDTLMNIEEPWSNLDAQGYPHFLPEEVKTTVVKKLVAERKTACKTAKPDLTHGNRYYVDV